MDVCARFYKNTFNIYCDKSRKPKHAGGLKGNVAGIHPLWSIKVCTELQLLATGVNRTSERRGTNPPRNFMMDKTHSHVCVYSSYPQYLQVSRLRLDYSTHRWAMGLPDAPSAPDDYGSVCITLCPLFKIMSLHAAFNPPNAHDGSSTGVFMGFCVCLGALIPGWLIRSTISL